MAYPSWVIIGDPGNNRVKIHDPDTMELIFSIYLDNEGQSEQACSDGTYVYVTGTSGPLSNQIHKYQISDGQLVATAGRSDFMSGPADDSFYGPSAIITDGTYLYVSDTINYRIKKLLCSDLSFVDAFGTYNWDYPPYPIGCAIVGDDLFVYDENMDGLFRIDKNTWRVKNAIDDFPDPYVPPLWPNLPTPYNNWPIGIVTDGTYLYTADAYADKILKFLASDLSFVLSTTTHLPFGFSNNDFVYGLMVDGEYLYTYEYSDELHYGNAQLIKRNLSDLSRIGGLSLSPPYWYNSYGAPVDANISPPPVIWDIYRDINENQYYLKTLETEGWVTKEFAELPPEWYPTGESCLASAGSHIYIGDYENSRIIRINKSDFSFVDTPVESDKIEFPTDIVSDGVYLYIVGYIDPWKVWKIDIETFTVQSTWICPYGWDVGPRMALDGNLLYITLPGPEEIYVLNKSDLSVFNRTGNASDLEIPPYPIGGNENSVNFNTGMTFDSTGQNLIIADQVYNRFVVHNKDDLSYVRDYPSIIGLTPEEIQIIRDANFLTPEFVSVDSNSMYLLEDASNIVKKINLSTLLVEESVEVMSGLLSGIAVTENYIFIISTSEPQAVLRYSKNLEYVDQFGEGSGDLQFSYPYSISVPISMKTLVSILINGSATIEEENTSAAYTIIATWSDSSTTTVSADMWSLDATIYASINGSGVVTTTLIPSAQSVTINASYTSGGITETASKIITITKASVPATILGSGASILESLSYDEKLLYWASHRILNLLLDNFTPKMRYQYQDSILFKSFIEAMAEELAATQLQIKQAVLQLNFQEAVSMFLNLWTQVIGLKKIEGELDIEYKNRLVNSLFVDKISNNAIKKALLVKYGFNSAINDAGFSPSDLTFANFDDKSVTAKLLSNYYEIAVEGVKQKNDVLDLIYEDAMSLTSLGNVIMQVVQEVNQLLAESNIYGAIYFQVVADSGDFTFSGGNTVQIDNQWTMKSSPSDPSYRLFDRNSYADDFVIAIDII